jgi:hypothetical protein
MLLSLFMKRNAKGDKTIRISGHKYLHSFMMSFHLLHSFSTDQRDVSRCNRGRVGPWFGRSNAGTLLVEFALGSVLGGLSRAIVAVLGRKLRWRAHMNVLGVELVANDIVGRRLGLGIGGCGMLTWMSLSLVMWGIR